MDVGNSEEWCRVFQKEQFLSVALQHINLVRTFCRVFDDDLCSLLAFGQFCQWLTSISTLCTHSGLI